jgi:hypothetical protein
MDCDIISAARSITAALACIDMNVLTHLVTHLGLKNTVHVVVSDNAEAAAVGL